MNMGNILIAATSIIGLLIAGQDIGVAITAILTIKVRISWNAQEQWNINQFPTGLYRKRRENTKHCA